MTNLARKNNEKLFILGIALAQGIALLLIWVWVSNLAIAGQYFQLILPLYVLALSLPLSLMLLAHQARRRLAFYLSAAFSLVAAFCAMHVGEVSYVNGLPSHMHTGWLFQFGFCMVVAWFIAVTFTEHYCENGNWSSHYASLYDFSWRNAVKLITASMFTGLFWMALLLLAGLFNGLGIAFFSTLIETIYFIYPATALAFGLGISLYNAKQDALSEFKRAILHVLAWLLPLISLMLIGFILTLPMVGINLLWKNGYDTGLVTMFSLLCLVVFLINCALQDGKQMLFPSWYAKLTNLATLTLPFYALLCAYGIAIRILALGWTDQRVWAVIAILIMSMYAFGYAYAAFKSFKQSQAWMDLAKPVNVTAAICIMSFIGLIYSPLLSPMRIGVQSQLSRLNDGKVDAAKFDYDYLRFSGGKYGDEALNALLADNDHPQAATIQPLVQATLKNQYRSVSARTDHDHAMQRLTSAKDLQAYVKVHPNNTAIDPSFFELLYSEYQSNQFYLPCLHSVDNAPMQSCHIVAVDLNHDQQDELIVLNKYDGRMYSKSANGWRYVTNMQVACCEQQKNKSDEALANEFEQALIDGQVSVVEPLWNNVKIGDYTYTMRQ